MWKDQRDKSHDGRTRMPSKGAHASPSRCIIEVSPSELTDGLYERCNGKEPLVVHPKNPEVAYHGNLAIFSEDLSHAILKLQTRAPNMETTTPEPSSLVPSPLRGACPSPVPSQDQKQMRKVIKDSNHSQCSLREEGFEAVDGHRDLLCCRAQQISVLVVLEPAQKKMGC